MRRRSNCNGQRLARHGLDGCVVVRVDSAVCLRRLDCRQGWLRPWCLLEGVLVFSSGIQLDVRTPRTGICFQRKALVVGSAVIRLYFEQRSGADCCDTCNPRSARYCGPAGSRGFGQPMPRRQCSPAPSSASAKVSASRARTAVVVFNRLVISHPEHLADDHQDHENRQRRSEAYRKHAGQHHP